MALPKIEIPTYEHTLTGLNKTVKFHGFTVKAEKILLNVKESNDIKAQLDATAQIINICTDGQVDAYQLPYFDLEDLFLRIRQHSVGSVVDLKYKLPSGDVTPLKVDLNDVKVVQNENHKDIIMIDDKQQIGIKMKYPTIETIDKFFNSDKGDDISYADKDFETIKECIDFIFHGDEITNPHNKSECTEEQFDEFLDSLELSVLEDIQEFFTTLPKLYYENTITLLDGTKEKIVLEGFDSFFN